MPAQLEPAMSTLTLELEDETNSLLQTEARKVNLSPAEFARLAIVRALARVGKDPYLEARAARGRMVDIDRILAKVPAAEPLPGDE
jgi:predicted transcriptional regulator